MKYYSLLVAILFMGLILRAQPTESLVAYYSFDKDKGSTVTDDTGNNSNGFIYGDTVHVCGVSGKALRFDGISNYVVLLGNVNSKLNVDFTISFYFKPTSVVGVRDLISKKEACNGNRAFSIAYNAAGKLVNTEYSENAGKFAAFSTKIDELACWQHVVFVRAGVRTLLYVNGVLKQQKQSASRITISNNAPLSISNGPCLATSQGRFAGFIDELRIYSRALDPDEIPSLYLAPDKIATRDAIIFLGNSVSTDITTTCAKKLTWQPTNGVENPNAGATRLTPDITTTYRLSFDDGVCKATDTIRVTVVDPNNLVCDDLYLPTAFTPNKDNLNDTYNISNPYAIEKLLSFEIIDRWGEVVFDTTDPFAGWDGQFQGKDLNPGVMVFRVRYRCNGEEKVKTGSFVLLR